MKKSLSIIMGVMLSVCVFSQHQVVFAYDESGNRVRREIMLTTKSVSHNEKTTAFNDQAVRRELKYYSSSEGNMTIELSTLDGMKSGVITVYKMDNGMKILSKRIQSLREELDITSQHLGVYILHVDIDGEITSWKFIKK